MVFCTEFLDGWGLESRCVGRVYGADGAIINYYYYYYELQLVCHPVAVVILHVYKI